MAGDWYDIKFLESTVNLKEILHRSYGHTVTDATARGVAVAIQQGRLFFEQANGSPIQIRPLLVYYGVLSFARAITAAANNFEWDKLVKSHGVSDTGDPTSVENLKLRCNKEGTFQQFNDAIAPIARFFYFDENAMPQAVVREFDKADILKGQDISFGDIVSRIPEMSGDFKKLYMRAANCMSMEIHNEQLQRWTLRIDDPFLVTDRSSLIALIESLRKSYPFLGDWRLYSVSQAWGNTILTLDNRIKQGENDLSEDELPQIAEGKFIGFDGVANVPGYNPLKSILPPMTGGYVRNDARFAIQPLHGVILNEYSLHFLGSFLLSSLVRYRPQIWQHAISRSATTGSPADDRALSLIEKFIDQTLTAFPRFVVQVLDYHARH